MLYYNKCSLLLNLNSHTDYLGILYNSYLRMATTSPNNAVTIGIEQMKYFESRLPQGLYETITKEVVTVNHARKHVKVGAVKVVDTNLSYSTVIGLQASGWNIDIKMCLVVNLRQFQRPCLMILEM